MVSKCKRVSDYTYFTGLNDESKAEAEAGLTANINESVAYYAKSDKVSGREAIGVYYVPNGSTPLFSNVKHGERAKTFDVMKNGDGIDPVTGDSVRSDSTRRKTSKGYDVMVAPPKAISVLLSQAEALAIKGSGNEAKFARDFSDRLQVILRKANDRAMQYVYDQGLFEVRYTEKDPETGKSITGEVIRAGAADMTAVQWMHFSSRDGDPQVHFHNVWYNSGRRPDGTTGTIDNHRLLKNMHSVNAIFNAEAIRGLAELGISVTKDGHNYSVDGSVKALETKFSKRSEKVLEVLKEEYGKDGRDQASAALLQAIVLKTRNSKSELPPLEQLILRWGLEAKAEGHNIFTLLEGMKNATELKVEKQDAEWAQKVAEAKEQGIELPAERPRFDMEEIRDRAFKGLTEHAATFEERELNAAILEELSMFCGADEALGLLEELKQSDKIIEIGMNGPEKVFSTPYIVGLERDLMSRTLDMMDVKETDRGVPADIVADIIAKGSISTATGERFVYRPDQKAGIEYFSGAQRVAIINGPPGAGKSAMMDGYVRAERACGRRVYGIAPTNRASIVLKDDAHIEAEHCRSVSGMIHDIESGRVQLGPNDVILCDEFGMVGLEAGAKLLAYVDQAGARFRGIGDRDQIQPVPFGAAMRSMMHFVDSRFMVHISRQKGWMLDASYALVAKDVAKAIGIYQEAGCLTLALSYEDMIERTVARHFKVTTENSGKSHVVIARTNLEVREINDRIRDGKIERGELATESVKFAAMTRGQKPYETEIEVSAGDRIIMGDNIKLGSDKIPNNSFGTVREIKQGIDGGEPRLKIELENGFIWEGFPSELTNQYNETSVDENGKRIPHIALAYAMTIYAAQGMTCDYSTMVNSVGMGIQTALVGMTRQRLGFELICDASRIHDKIAARGGAEVSMSKKTGATKEDDAEPDAEISDEQIREELIKEMSQDESKKNVSDYQADKLAFAKGETKQEDKVISKEESEAADKLEAQAETKSEPQAEARSPTTSTRNRVRGLGQFGMQPEVKAETKSAGDILRQRMQERATSSEHRAMPRPNRPMPGTRKSFENQRVPDEEMVYLTKQNLAAYAESELKLKADGTENFQGRTFNWFQAPDGGYLSIEQQPTEVWTWIRRDGTNKGVIWNLIDEVKGGGIGRAIRDLRDYFGSREMFKDPLSSSPSRDRRQEIRVPESAPQTAVEKKTFKEKMRETRTVKWTAEKFAPIVDRFGKMKTVEQVGPSKLLLARGIDERTQRTFGKDIRHEWSKSYLNPNGVAFPHKDLDGNIWTFARKGEKKDPRDKRSFSQMAGVAKEHAVDVEKHRKRCGLMGNIVDPMRFYVAESEIDGKSLYQLDRDAFEAGRGRPVPPEDKICIVSTYGNPSYRGLDDLSLLSERNPDAEVHVAMDNDRAGRHLSGLVHEAVKAGRGDDAVIYERISDPTFKDWNTQLMSKRTTAEIQGVWDSSVPAENRYLTSQGISRDLQQAVWEDVRMEAKRDEGGNLVRTSIDGVTNARGVLVALRDRDLHLTGYVRLGSEIDPTTAREFRRSESIGQNGVVVMGEHEKPTAFYAGQETRDVLKMVEKDGRPEGFCVLVAETGPDNRFNEEQRAVFTKFATEHPEAKWHFVPEGTGLYHPDVATRIEQNAAEMRMTIREANPSADIEDRVSASMLQPIPERKQPEMQVQQERDLQPEAEKKVDEQKAKDVQVEDAPEAIRRQAEQVQEPVPTQPAPQADNSAAEAAARAAAVQAAQENEERRRRSQQGMGM